MISVKITILPVNFDLQIRLQNESLPVKRSYAWCHPQEAWAKTKRMATLEPP